MAENDGPADEEEDDALGNGNADDVAREAGVFFGRVEKSVCYRERNGELGWTWYWGQSRVWMKAGGVEYGWGEEKERLS